MAETAIIKITIRKGTTLEWEDANPILLDGEFGFDTTTKVIFIGNGEDDYSTLIANNANRLTSIALLNSSFNTLQTSINNEASTRASADTAINATVTALSGTVTTISSTLSSVVSDLAQLSSDFNTWYGEVATKGKIPVVSENLGRASLLAVGSDGQVLTADSTKDQGVDWKTLNKSTVGLSNVDNTSDTDKPVSTAQSSAISSAVSAVTKTSLGLGNVDNTSDANKPVSTAQAAAIGARELSITAPADSSKFWDGTKAFRALTTSDIPGLNAAITNRKSFLYFKRSGLWYNNAINQAAYTTFALTANSSNAYMSFLVIEETITITDIAVENTVAGSAGSIMYFGIYQVTNPNTSYNSGPLVAANTTGISVATTGVKSLTLPSPVVLTPGVYLVTTTNNSTTAVTMRTIAAGSTYAVGGTTAVTSLVAVGFTATRASFGALPSDLSGFTALNQANTTPPLILWFKVQ